MRTRRADVFSVLGGLVRAYRRLHWALLCHYRRRARRPLTPQQEAERLVTEMHRRQEAVNRLMWRR